ncbi:hypothetical protein [Pantoea sp. CCBC3-3-1]|uniref:hypothetical protein n=1 Tax=Pantoea sp. CCBC3-3-1 TaxID=2490851 RepID=UPI0011BE2B03|nr:hypothetical protein [Pantoea sp. CCBC3-3-1]
MTNYTAAWSAAIATEPFASWRITTARTLWHNPDRLPEYMVSQGLPWTAENMATLWGYAIPGGDSFPAEQFDLHSPATMYAEAYGGEGGAANGGGARAGNLRGVQLKGIGANMFVGATTDKRHGYGAFYLEHAIVDAIYSQLVSRLLPLGSVTIYGIIDSGLTIHFRDPEKNYYHSGAGGILLREECLRLGHFLPAQEFVPRQHQRQVMTNPQRMRQVMQKLMDSGRGDSAIEHLLLNFLGSSAKQLAWARASRLKHGALTPSNIGVDGRWLDLSQTSMLPLGVNQRITPQRLPFLQESFAPPDFALEVLHFYNKYTQRRATLGGAIRHYDLSWQRAYQEALLAQSGMQFTHTTAAAAAAVWVEALSQEINSNPLPFTDAVDEKQQDDGFTELLLCAWAGLDKPTSDAQQQALGALIEADWQQAQARGGWLNRQQHQRCCLLRAWRRSAFSPLFWRSRVYLAVNDICQPETGDVAGLMNELTAVMDFAYGAESVEGEVALLKLNDVQISWRPVTDSYRLVHQQQIIEFAHASDLAHALSALSLNWTRWRFDFRRPLLRLLEALGSIQ